MFRWLANLLYGSVDAEFESSFGLEESIQRLRNATSRSIFSALTRQRAVGPVKETRVSLQRVIPFVGNSWKPFFLGRFVIRDGHVILVGRFTTLKFVKVFMSLWLGFLLAWTIAEAAVLIVQRSGIRWFPIYGFGLICIGIGFIWFGKWLARNDVAWLSKVIEHALSNESTSSNL